MAPFLPQVALITLHLTLFLLFSLSSLPRLYPLELTIAITLINLVSMICHIWCSGLEPKFPLGPPSISTYLTQVYQGSRHCFRLLLLFDCILRPAFKLRLPAFLGLFLYIFTCLILFIMNSGYIYIYMFSTPVHTYNKPHVIVNLGYIYIYMGVYVCLQTRSEPWGRQCGCLWRGRRPC